MCPKLWCHEPLLSVRELCVWSVGYSVLLSWSTTLCVPLRPLYTTPCLLAAGVLVCHSPRPVCGMTIPCMSLTAVTLTCPVGSVPHAANVGPQLDPRGAHVVGAETWVVGHNCLKGRTTTFPVPQCPHLGQGYRNNNTQHMTSWWLLTFTVMVPLSPPVSGSRAADIS